jgi:hypothetical protein
MVVVLVTGSRSFDDVNKVFEILDKEINVDDEVITGGASGIDSIVKIYCECKKIKYRSIRPINPNNNTSYLCRNAEMIGMCDKCVAIWDGKSTGTIFTFNYAKKRGKIVKMYEVD